MCSGLLWSALFCSRFHLPRFGLLTPALVCSCAKCLMVSQVDPSTEADRVLSSRHERGGGSQSLCLVLLLGLVVRPVDDDDVPGRPVITDWS